VNCAALAPSLISSELFGHEKARSPAQRSAERAVLSWRTTGPFPGRSRRTASRYPGRTSESAARTGIERVGGTGSIKVDVRVIAATNRNLETPRRMERSLGPLYRLNVSNRSAAARQRKDDVLMLLEYFVHRYAKKVGKNFGKINKRTSNYFDLTIAWQYPRATECRRESVIVSSDGVFGVDEAWLSRDSGKRRATSKGCKHRSKLQSRAADHETALAESRGRVSGPNGAAARLQIPPSTLESKIKK